MEHPVLITWLNDFIFCPASIYFHNLYGEPDRMSFQEESQINGTFAHKSIDEARYSDRTEVLCGTDVFCEEYGLIGKIDIFNTKTGELAERKKRIKTVYDGYVFQLYAQCFALREMGYTVKRLCLRSLDDHRVFPVALPEDDASMLEKFLRTLQELENFELSSFHQENREKCARCIYEPLCSCSLLTGGGANA